MKHLYLTLLVAVCLCCYPLPASAALVPVLSNIAVTQSITQQNGQYMVTPAVQITFTLASKQEVTVRIARHLATIGGDANANPPGNIGQYYYVVEPLPVRTLALGQLDAGMHTVSWDGLDAQHNPVMETQAYPWKVIKRQQTVPAELTQRVPVQRFRFTVQAGGETLATNFERADSTVSASRVIRFFMGAAFDSRGELLAAGRLEWIGLRFSPEWEVTRTYPAVEAEQSAKPIETEDVAVDSHDNVYFIGTDGVYKYTPDGKAAAFAADADYINYPYPSTVRNLLGVRMDLKVQGKRDYIFGPGGNGRHKFWDAAEMTRQPGFSGQWGGLAIGPDDTLFLGKRTPEAKVEAFDITGAYLRSLPLPMPSNALRIGRDGLLWVATDKGLLALDEKTSEVKTQLPVPTRLLHLGKDGTLYAVLGSRLCRINGQGTFIPFTAKERISKDGTFLDIAPSKDMPDMADGYAKNIVGVVGGTQGDFYLAVANTGNPFKSIDHRLLHFAADGTFLPDTLQSELEQYMPGNVFQDDQPAAVQLYCNNLLPRERMLQADWTLQDFYGDITRGTMPVRLGPLARQAVILPIPAKKMGHYTLTVTLREAGQRVAGFTTAIARIRTHDLAPDVDSPFGLCWGVNHYLMGIAGIKIERNSPICWDKLEPQPGVTLPYPDDAIQWAQGIEGHHRYAMRWGRLQDAGLHFGEPWFGGGVTPHLYSYDRFYQYCLRVTDMAGGVKEGYSHYQFWNEPNFSWGTKPSEREDYSLVAKHAWSIVKARHKDSLEIADGDAGGTKIMAEMAATGASLYNDGVQIHYPGARAVTFDNIIPTGHPEAKVQMMQELIALRDRYYPGKPVWNTEEGWWAAPVKTPEVGAQVIPRIYLSQIAAGVDKIFWFEMGRGASDPTSLLGPQNVPYPSYCSYATMTRLLGRAVYVGPVDVGDQAYAYLFVRDDHAILAAWAKDKDTQVSLPVGTPSVVLTDLMDRETTVTTKNGVLALALTASPQYVTLPYNAWTKTVAGAELKRRLTALQVDRAEAIPAEIARAAATAATDAAAMSRLYYLVKAAETAAVAGQALPGDGKAVAAARAAIETREGADGYLRQARVAIGWAERLSRVAASQHGDLSKALAHAAAQAASAAQAIAAAERPCYPGVVIDAYLETSKIRQQADPQQPLDEKFPLQITRAPSAIFELELTVWNYYRHPIAGVVTPRLPEDWTVTPANSTYNIAPGAFHRVIFTVTIPAGTARNSYSVGGQSSYQGQTIEEIHSVRVKVE